MSVAKARLNPLQHERVDCCYGKALYLISANKMARNLDGDMRQGPKMCACSLGFIQQIITINAREIKLQPFIQEFFAEIYLQLTKKSSSKP
jgi:hypothetical protein